MCGDILRYYSNNVERFVSVGIFILWLNFKYKTILLRMLIMIEYLLFGSSEVACLKTWSWTCSMHFLICFQYLSPGL